MSPQKLRSAPPLPRGAQLKVEAESVDDGVTHGEVWRLAQGAPAAALSISQGEEGSVSSPSLPPFSGGKHAPGPGTQADPGLASVRLQGLRELQAASLLLPTFV